MTLFSILLQNENRTEGERKTLKIIKNNYAPSNVRTICPICGSIFEFDPATECDERTVICPASPLEKNILR